MTGAVAAVYEEVSDASRPSSAITPENARQVTVMSLRPGEPHRFAQLEELGADRRGHRDGGGDARDLGREQTDDQGVILLT